MCDELFILRIPKPVYLPTRCSVWEASAIDQSKLGKQDKAVFGITLSEGLDRIDGEPMEFEWINSQGSRQCTMT